jgi:hypothetical protein
MEVEWFKHRQLAPTVGPSSRSSANSKDFFKINLPEIAAAQANSAETSTREIKMKSTSRPALTCCSASTLLYSLHRVRDRINFEAGVDLRFHGRLLVSAVPVRNGINFLERRQVRSRGWRCLLFGDGEKLAQGIRLAGNYPPTAKLLLLSALAKIQFDLCCTHTESHVKKQSSVAPFAPTKTWKIIYYVLPKGIQCSC